MSYWPTFGQMGRDGKRTWFRMSDLVDAAACRGAAFTRYQVRRIIAHLPHPAVKRYGHWHYTEAHRQAVIEAAILAAAAKHQGIPDSSTPRGAMA
jgi:hypothetical protein